LQRAGRRAGRGGRRSAGHAAVLAVRAESARPSLGELVGGSADLSGSNNTFRKDSRAVTPADAGGNYINYGVREFAMTAIMTGLALHGGFRPTAALS